MVPAALVERDERHAGLDQAAGEQAALAERRCGRSGRGPCRVSRPMSKARWASRRATSGRSPARSTRRAPRPGRRPPCRRTGGSGRRGRGGRGGGRTGRRPGRGAGRRRGRGSPALFGSSGTTNGAYFAPRKFGPPERDMLGIEKYGGSPPTAPRSCAATEPEAGVEADERAAADRDPGRGAGHHVVVARAVVPLVVADRPDDRRACRRSPPAASSARRSGRRGPAWRSARTRRGSRSGAAAWGRTSRSGSARRPSRSGCSSSAGRPASAASPRSRRASTRPPPIRAPRPRRRQSRRVVDSQFVEIPIGSRLHQNGAVGRRPADQSLKTNSAEFSSAHSRSSIAARRSTRGRRTATRRRSRSSSVGNRP